MSEAGVPIQIEIDVLKEAVNRLLRELQATAGGVVLLDEDFYTDLPPAVRRDVGVAPAEYTIGSYIDAYDAIVSIAKSRESDGPVMPYAIVWIGDLLKAIGQRHIS